MSNVFFGADGRFYNISPTSIALSGEVHQSSSSQGMSASTKGLYVDDQAAALEAISFNP
jgi:hypothetical protein